MEEMFEEVFAEVMQELGLEAWYELYDSEDFDLVCHRISERLGYDCWESSEFIMWQCTMGEDL